MKWVYADDTDFNVNSATTFFYAGLALHGHYPNSTGFLDRGYYAFTTGYGEPNAWVRHAY